MSLDGEAVRGYHHIEPQHALPSDGRIAGEMASAEKRIGVLCHGPWVLIDTGLLTGRTLTCVPALRRDVQNAGATYRDVDVYVDRRRQPLIVSVRNFEAAPAFARTLVEALAAGQSGKRSPGGQRGACVAEHS